jgi:3-phosphoshikimate 1-carboxyvinyltransferase
LISPTRSLSGRVQAPPSKAQTHRALFAGLLSCGTTTIHNPLSCDDTKASANTVSSLGAKLQLDRETWKVEGDGMPHPPSERIDCGESGVTLRFTIPIASLVEEDVKLSGSAGLMRRPLQPLIEAMNQLGVSIDPAGLEVKVKAASVKGGRVQIPGNVSSQFISGLLFAGPLMKEGLEISVTSPLESRGYVALTIETLKQHGINVQKNREMSLFHVAPHQTYWSADHTIPGDYSSAAFLMSAAAVTGSRIIITGLSQDEWDPDSAFLKILNQMGARSSFSSVGLHVEGLTLKASKVNISNCPDLGPVIAVLGACADGKTEITGAERLRYKESDRLTAIASELTRLGGEVKVTDDGMIVSGPSNLRGGTVDSHGDHRIAMALVVAALNAAEPITIRNAQSVNKSYPTFFDDIRSLGVEVTER